MKTIDMSKVIQERFGTPDAYQMVYKFDNGYGASVIRHKYSYGGDEGLFELAVIRFENEDAWHLCYDTPITEDVLGHLEEEEVLNILNKIELLKAE